VGNLIFLWIFGSPLELDLGRVLMVLTYAVTFYFSGLGGATCAILGGYLALRPTGLVSILVPGRIIRIPSWMFALGWVLLILLWTGSGMTPGYSFEYFRSEMIGTGIGFAIALLASRSGIIKA
jgi:membrane associated rhomboid family serine protease